ncbi:MAG: TlpA family protein disulfide reductase [Proteobacteria bacterium]|nr:TlpA family protein disulfide reductase [Pseudomonadota bacterium]
MKLHFFLMLALLCSCGGALPPCAEGYCGLDDGDIFLSRAELEHFGEDISIPKLGKVVVLYFWASWCEPCKTIVKPEMERLWSRADKNHLTIIGVNSCDKISIVRKELSLKPQVSYPNVADRELRLKSKYKVGDNLPVVIVIDRQGTVRLALKGDAYNPGLVEHAVKVLQNE